MITLRIPARYVFLAILFNGVTNASSPPTLRVAIVTPESGGSAYFGTVIRNGIILAIEEQNLEKQSLAIDYQVWDDQSDPSLIPKIFEQVVTWNADVVIGPVESNTAARGADAAAANLVPVITPSATASFLTEPGNEFFFRAITSDGPRADDLAKWMTENYAPTYFVIYEGRSDSEKANGEPLLYGEAVGLDVSRWLTKQDRPYATYVYSRKGLSDASCEQIVKEIVEKQFTAAAILGRSTDTLKIADRIREAVPNFPMFFLSPGREAFVQHRAVWGYTYAVTDSVIENTEDPRLLRFRAKYFARFETAGNRTNDDPVGQYATFGYDAAQIVIDAATVALANNEGAKSEADRRVAIRDAIKATPNERQGLLSIGGFTSHNELNFVPHRQILTDGVWHEPGFISSDGREIGMSLMNITLLIVVILILIGLLMWLLPRLVLFDSRVLNFVIFVFVGLVAASILFGTLRSYASVHGVQLGVGFEFGGAAALFIAVVCLGLWNESRPKALGGPFQVNVICVDDGGMAVDVTGRLRLLLPGAACEFPVEHGHAVLANLPASARNVTVSFVLNVDRQLKRGARSELRLTPDAEHRLVLAAR